MKMASFEPASSRDWQSQAHVKHYCKYHVVFVPKYRRQSIYGALPEGGKAKLNPLV